MEAARAEAARPAAAPRRRGALGRPARWAALALALVVLTTAGCAMRTTLRRARQAEQAQDYDRAIAEYTRALRRNPGDLEARASLEHVKVRAADLHFNRGRRLVALGKLDEAVVELQIASELNPAGAEIDRELRAARNQLRAKVSVTRDGRTGLETLVARMRNVTSPGLELPHDLKLPDSLVFRNASSRDVFTAMARFAGVNIVFDPAFRDAPLSIDLRNSAFEDALAAVTGATRTFYRVPAARTVTIVPDTPAKRREYEEEVVRTFYLSNADLKETIDMLRVVMDLKRIAPITATNALSVRDTPERVQAAGRLIAAIDKARPEVIVDVELLEVNRTHLAEYGLQVASPGTTEGINGVVNPNSTDMTLLNLRHLTQSGVFLTGLPSLYYRLMKSDSSTRILANPQLRTSEGVTAQAKFGERVPVPTTTLTLTTTGVTSVSYNYENIGVNIDLTPRTHHDDDVSLQLKVEVSSVSGTGYDSLPTFGNRTVSTVIRLKDGETSILGGLIRDDERTVFDGLPGISELPIVGRLFARNHKEREETDIILTLTPHIVRVLDLTESDLRPFRLGRENEAAAEQPVGLPPRDLPKQPVKDPRVW